MLGRLSGGRMATYLVVAAVGRWSEREDWRLRPQAVG